MVLQRAFRTFLQDAGAMLEPATITDVFVLLAMVLWLPAVLLMGAVIWAWMHRSGDGRRGSGGDPTPAPALPRPGGGRVAARPLTRTGS
jgi:hypothetical protein